MSLEPNGHVEPAHQHAVLGAEVEGRRIVGMVVADFGAKLQDRAEIMAPADGMARIESLVAGAFALRIVPDFVAEGQVIHAWTA